MACPGENVVSEKSQLKLRSVRSEGVEWEVSGAGGLECLDSVLDLGVLTMRSLKRGDVLVGLIGDEALEAVPIHVGEGSCAGMGTLAAAISLVPSGHEERSMSPVSSVTATPRVAHHPFG